VHHRCTKQLDIIIIIIIIIATSVAITAAATMQPGYLSHQSN
jgi:hypothetical protein